MTRTLDQIPGTVANVFKERFTEIEFDSPVPVLKQQIITILSSEEIKNSKGAQKFISHIQSLKSRNAIMSTVVTYVTCIKTGTTKKGF